MKIRYLLLMLLPVLALASGGGSGETDIVPRTINFVIFAAILYYMIAEPAKEFYFGRKGDIAKKLDSIQLKLKESNAKKEMALQKVEEAKVSAKVIVETAKKESKILVEKIEKDFHAEVENLEKSFGDKVAIEKRKMIRTSVSEVLEELFKEGSISLGKEEFVKIVTKKVA
ncbi:MAG: F0F1 ATP synthase subunit B [Sulfurospirillaceae bacterium]|nr:F0F1 ATP synthase subunit B [Sulfurospirillaceae bacterium]MDD3463696.1 F0F1 ATP synthase subunit B [Sulfurospirillaceae bacterium]